MSDKTYRLALVLEGGAVRGIYTAGVLDVLMKHGVQADMVIGTSALPGHKIDGAVNIYAGIYNNPFLIWGSYRRQMFRAKLPISFQFHHTQMDGMEAAHFLDRLQAEIDRAGGQGGLL